jgi:hypothetical protein
MAGRVVRLRGQIYLAMIKDASYFSHAMIPLNRAKDDRPSDLAVRLGV